MKFKFINNRIEDIRIIKTSHIIIFVSGIISTTIFNLLVNKEPFKIDSDSISALANVGTFLVALIAALQVKKWLDNKINERAFKQCDKIIDIIENSHKDIAPLFQQFSEMKRLVAMVGPVELDQKEKDKIDKNTISVDIFCNTLSMNIGMLDIWKVQLTENKQKQISNFISSMRLASLKLKELKLKTNDLEEKIRVIDELFKDGFSNLNAFIKGTYVDIFDHTPSESIKNK